MRPDTPLLFVMDGAHTVVERSEIVPVVSLFFTMYCGLPTLAYYSLLVSFLLLYTPFLNYFLLCYFSGRVSSLCVIPIISERC